MKSGLFGDSSGEPLELEIVLPAHNERLSIGKTLEEILGKEGVFGPHEATLIGIDLCHALAAVHAAGLIHQDRMRSSSQIGGRDMNALSKWRSGIALLVGVFVACFNSQILDNSAPEHFFLTVT